MDLKEQKSNIYNSVPDNAKDKLLYACDVGDLEYIKHTINTKKININKKFTDVWYLEGYYEEIERIDNKKLILIQKSKQEENTPTDYFEEYRLLSKEYRQIKDKYTSSCPYGSLLDAMIRFSIESKKWTIIEYLLNLDDALYSKCFQSFFVALDYNLIFITDKLIEEKVDLHIYANGYVKDKIMYVLNSDKDIDSDNRNKVLKYIEDNFDISKIR